MQDLFRTFANALVSCQFSGWSVFLKGHWRTDTFVTNYIPFVMFPILYLGAKWYFRVPVALPENMDFVTGLKEVEADTHDEPPPRNAIERFWAWLVSMHSIIHLKTTSHIQKM